MTMTEVQHFNVAETQHQYFCYLTFQRFAQACVGAFFCLLCFIILAITLYQARKVYVFELLSRKIGCLYSMVVAWSLLYAGKMILAEYIFWKDYGDEGKDREESWRFNSSASLVMFALGVICMVLQHTIFIISPYNWLQNLQTIYQLANQYRQGNQIIKSTTSPISSTSKLFLLVPSEFSMKKQLRFMRIIKRYLQVSRFIFGCMIVLFLCSFEGYDMQLTFFSILMILIWLQESAAFIILFFTIRLIKSNSSFTRILDGQELRSMIKQYRVLIVGMLVRIVADVPIMFINTMKETMGGQEKTTCSIADDPDGFHLTKILIFVIDVSLTHYLTLCVVLYIHAAGSSKHRESYAHQQSISK